MPVILSIISVCILVCVHGRLLPVSCGFIGSTSIVALSQIRRSASSSFLLHRESILRTPLASVIVYAPISPTFPIVSTLPLSENHGCASAVAWIFRNLASVRSDHFASKVITNVFPFTIYHNLFCESLYSAIRYCPYLSRFLSGFVIYSVPMPCPVSYWVKRYCASFGT